MTSWLDSEDTFFDDTGTGGPRAPVADVEEGPGYSTEDLGVPYENIARVDKRTKDLIVRLRPGEIAVIDHEDIDRLSAEGLVRAKGTRQGCGRTL